MIDSKIVIIIIIAIICYIIFNVNKKEGFKELNNTWLWYRSPYSIHLWEDTVKRHRLWSANSRNL